MMGRLRLLLCALLLAPLPAPPAGAAEPRPGAVAEVESVVEQPDAWGDPTIEARTAPLGSGARAAEGAELLTTLAQILATGCAAPRYTAGMPAPGARRATAWCDVVQCRRCGGTRLLCYATPPPARA